MKSAIQTIVSTIMGLISGILIYAMFSMLFGQFISSRIDTDSQFLFIASLLFVIGGSQFISSFILGFPLQSICSHFQKFVKISSKLNCFVGNLAFVGGQVRVTVLRYKFFGDTDGFCFGQFFDWRFGFCIYFGFSWNSAYNSFCVSVSAKDCE